MNPAPLVRIFIDDDEAANLRALCETLRDHGYETTGVTTRVRRFPGPNAMHSHF